MGSKPSARQSDGELSPFFVIEADEYDTAFFDKRSKFVHYHPRTVVLNNLEFDHADIFSDLAAIQRQFHHLVRIVPNNGLIILNGNDKNLQQVIEQGCWTSVEQFGITPEWHTRSNHEQAVEIYYQSTCQGYLQWELLGEHNRMNALAALIAARHVGVSIQTGIEALKQFRNVKRRMEIRGRVNNITIYDDFAHHPTAIRTTIDGLRHHVGKQKIIAVLEPRSNTMKMGIWKNLLADSLLNADQVFCFTDEAQWTRSVITSLGEHATAYDDLEHLIQAIVRAANPSDHILIMSNGGFGGIHEKIIDRLRQQSL